MRLPEKTQACADELLVGDLIQRCMIPVWHECLPGFNGELLAEVDTTFERGLLK